MLYRGEAKKERSPNKRKAAWNTVETSPAISRAISVIGKKMKLRAAGELETLPLKSPPPTIGSPLRGIRKSIKQTLPTRRRVPIVRSEARKRKKTASDEESAFTGESV